MLKKKIILRPLLKPRGSLVWRPQNTTVKTADHEDATMKVVKIVWPLFNYVSLAKVKHNIVGSDCFIKISHALPHIMRKDYGANK